MSEANKRVIVIGGGIGGYVAAIRASQLGGQVTLVEKDTLGGTCLNRGCIPTKSLLYSASVLWQMKKAAVFGISVQGASLDFKAASRHKQDVVDELVGGVSILMKKNRITVISGTGSLVGPRKVKVTGDNEMQIETDKIIIATGSEPSPPPIDTVENEGVITSHEALTLQQLPESIIIIGAGVVGLEFAQIFHRMNAKVTVIEMMPQVLPGEDTEVARILEETLRTEGIDIFTNAEVKDVRADDHRQETVSFIANNAKRDLSAEKVLMAVGRRPCTRGLGVEKLGIASQKGGILVNERMEATVPGIYAIGDVVGGVMLAHVAIAEGKCAAQNAMGIESKMNYQAIPRCIYTSPEVAAVGLTETEARTEYDNVKVGRFPFRANGKALVLDEQCGMVKMIAEGRYGQVLGVEIIGPQATEMIAESVLGIQLEATVNDFVSAVHAHPTLSETVVEAALSVEAKPIHI